MESRFIADIFVDGANAPMDVKFTKGKDRDYIQVCRADGTMAATTFPKKGMFPHDAIHLIVERRLEYNFGFWGRILDGAMPEDISAIAKAGGHASSTRAGKPAEDIVELLCAERLVECFEAEMWSKHSDNATLRSVLGAACSQSKISVPNVSDEDISSIRGDLKQLLAEWQSLAIGESLRLCWRQQSLAGRRWRKPEQPRK
jgi:hypothetical protein